MSHAMLLRLHPLPSSRLPAALSFKPAGGCWCYFEVSAIAEFEHGKETEAEAGCCEGLDGEERVFENSSKLSLHDRGGISSPSGGQARSIKHKRLVDLAAFD